MIIQFMMKNGMFESLPENKQQDYLELFSFFNYENSKLRAVA